MLTEFLLSCFVPLCVGFLPGLAGPVIWPHHDALLSLVGEVVWASYFLDFDWLKFSLFISFGLV